MENKEKSVQEPAFPMCNSEGMPTYVDGKPNFGMSKRFYAACAAMQGLLANQHISEWVSTDIYSQRKQVAETAFSFADYLLKQENE